jgi:hypothetical protein
VPGTAAPPAPAAAATVNVPAAVTVAAFIASLNVAVIFWLMGTLMAPFKGFVDATVGIVPLVKLQAKLAANAAPLGSWAPVVTVATYTVFAASKFVGVKVAVVPEYVTAPATAAPPGPVNVNVVVLIVAGAIAELKPAVTAVLRATPVAAFAGDAAITVGSAGLGACSLPHPARANNKNAPNIFPTVSVRISVSYSCSETMQDLFHSKPAIQQSFQWNQDAQDIDSKGMTVRAS